MAYRVGMYLRKSAYTGKRGVERGRSVSEQETENRRALDTWNDTAPDDRRMALADIYTDDDRSATRYARREREDYQRLIADVEAGKLDVVQAWQSTRVQRDLAAYVRLRDLCWEHGVLWYYNGRMYDLSRREDRLATGLEALIGEDQAEQVRTDILRTVRSRAVEGRPHGKILYGYRREYDPETGKPVRQVPREDQAVIVREAGARVAAGEAPNAVAASFNERGIPAPRDRGAGWDLVQVKRMLTNRAYIARRMHRGEDVGEAQWPAILDEATYYACESRLRDPARQTTKDYAVKHLLSGIAVCGVCGTPVRVVPNRGYPSYTCWSRTSMPEAAGVGRFHVTRRESKVDGFVEAVLFAWLSREDAGEWLRPGDDPDVRAAWNEVETLRGRLEAFYQQAEAGELSAHALSRMEQKLRPQIQAAERRARRVRLPGAVADLIQPTPELVEAAWRDLGMTTRREVIRHLMTVRLMRVGRGRRGADPRESIIVEPIPS